MTTLFLVLPRMVGIVAMDRATAVETWIREATAAPQMEVVSIEVQKRGIKLILDGANSSGQVVRAEFVGKSDGRDYPVTGMPDADTISLARIDSYTIDCLYKKNGNAVKIERMVVSKKRTRATVFRKGEQSPPQDFAFVGAWRKE